ncbi:hypothetical protein CUR178_04471 [Leishmania enriettii]|uniref:Amastin-like protein n=1 Tax=Leishmania enriettii TaxID=5663 RepID=A0A836GHA5_LEIEN|nr:hypothetical protein CUR178_04471 [Leishmania enriettii]
MYTQSVREMMDAAETGRDASWDSDRRIDRLNPSSSPHNIENTATPAERSETVAVKPSDPFAPLTDSPQSKVFTGNMSEFDYTPTLNLRRVSRCRVDSFAALLILLVTFMGCMFALLTSIFTYKSPTAVVNVDCLNVQGFTDFGLRRSYSTHEIFCPNYFTKSDIYAALYILTVFAVVVGFCFTLFLIICDRVLLCDYFVHSLIILSWLFILGALIMAAVMYRVKLCHGMSLKEVGFRLGPAFGVTGALFSFLSVALIVVVALAVKYRRKH